jgi:hypothetical protein
MWGVTFGQATGEGEKERIAKRFVVKRLGDRDWNRNNKVDLREFMRM